MQATFSLPMILGIVFIVLKLIGYIVWSWLWVLSPFWVPLALALVIFAFAGVVLGNAFTKVRKW